MFGQGAITRRAIIDREREREWSRVEKRVPLRGNPILGNQPSRNFPLHAPVFLNGSLGGRGRRNRERERERGMERAVDETCMFARVTRALTRLAADLDY